MKNTAEEIAKEILYLPVTNGQAEASIAKGAELIQAYHEQGDGWIRVEDGLPEPNKPVRAVITYGNGKMEEIRTMYIARTECFDHLLCDMITHWQPIQLPSPPKQ